MQQDPARWLRIESLMDAALDLPPGQREAYLRQACGDDAALCDDVLALIEAGERDDGFLKSPAAEYAATLVESIEEPPPATVGPYRIVRELGRGGMGTVYLAEREAHFQQRVALKLVRHHRYLGGELRRRFEEERQILASLTHPGIARLLDGGMTPEGLPWFAMELVEGQRLDQAVASLSGDARIDLFLQVCDAVASAHELRVVHRDLKPGNVLVTGDGTVRLLDFGIAKLLEGDRAEEGGLTRTGERLLTPEYASPEQLRGEAVTFASDVYSLGVMLHELLTGQRPLTSRPGRTPLKGARAAIVMKALDPDPAKRYATAAELAADLRNLRAGLPVKARGSRRMARVAALIALAAVLALVAGWVAEARPWKRAAANRLYQEGMRSFHAGDQRNADRLFAAALDEDSTLVMAAYYHAMAARTAFPERARRFQRALQLSDNADDRERLIIRAEWAYQTISPSLAALAESLVIRYPDELAGELFTGISLIRHGRYLDAMPRLHRVIDRDSASLATPGVRCLACEAFEQLIGAAVLADSLDMAEREARRWTRLQAEASAPWAALYRVLATMGQTQDALEALRVAGNFSPDVRQREALDIAAALAMGDNADAAERVLMGQVASGAADRRLPATYWYLAIVLRHQGRLDEALRAARWYRDLQSDADTAGELWAAEAQVRFERGEYRLAAALFDSAAAWEQRVEWSPNRDERIAWRLTHVASALAGAGDIAAVEHLADSIELHGKGSDEVLRSNMHHYVRGLVHRLRGDDEAAIAALRLAVSHSPRTFSRASLELAWALMRRGRAEEAVTVLQPLLQSGIEGANFYNSRADLHEALAEAWAAAGAADSAAAHNSAVIAAMTRADPSFRGRQEAAKQRAARIRCVSGGCGWR